ncbi:MAG: gamma-glutamylcyclotransferase [Myxococcales bacterium]|nr:gamma-glutamylcyclotransferase [Myxococcales bacterium]
MSVYLVFGFGSLINSHSRARTLGTVPAWPVRVAGLRRGFLAPSARIRHTALGVRVEAGAHCNGILARVPAERIAALDAREAQYRRIEVAREAVLPLARPLADGTIVTYVPIAPCAPSEANPVIRSYVDVTLSGCLEYGEAFAHELLDSTDHFLDHLEDDRASPRYPLHEAHAPRSTLDSLVERLEGVAFDVPGTPT